MSRDIFKMVEKRVGKFTGLPVISQFGIMRLVQFHWLLLGENENYY